MVTFALRRRCIFCPNPRTNKRGEHVWDDWLNREDGKDIRRAGTVTHWGADEQVILEYPSDRLDVTLPVVCDHCNSTWMSDLSTHAKSRLEPLIRRDKASDFDALDIVVITAFAFLKAAVVDWSRDTPERRHGISRSACTMFRRSLTEASSDSVVFPDGLQVWIAQYRRTQTFEAKAFSEELSGSGPFKGYRIALITYVVGSFIFQLACPRWTRVTRNRNPPPLFQIVGDVQSAPIWPGVSVAYWPPPTYINSGSLQGFRERFRSVRVPIDLL